MVPMIRSVSVFQHLRLFYQNNFQRVQYYELVINLSMVKVAALASNQFALPHHRHNLNQLVIVTSVKQCQYPFSGTPLDSTISQIHLKFPFNLVGQSTMAFLTSQSLRILKSLYTGEGPEQGFWHYFTDVRTPKVWVRLWHRLYFAKLLHISFIFLW